MSRRTIAMSFFFLLARLLQIIVRPFKKYRIFQLMLLFVIAASVLTWVTVTIHTFFRNLNVPTSLQQLCERILVEEDLYKCDYDDVKYTEEDYDKNAEAEILSAIQKKQSKVIMRWTKYNGQSWKVPRGHAVFYELFCPESRCVLTDNPLHLFHSHAVLVHEPDAPLPEELPKKRPNPQHWVLLSTDSPYHVHHNLSMYNGLFNLSATYSSTSDLPIPFGEFQPHSFLLNEEAYLARNFALGKRRLIAWITNDCKAPNHREAYVRELSKYVRVDIFGPCGNLHCRTPEECINALRYSYKFVLAFEDSNCQEYITRTFWNDALGNDIVPVVMGASLKDFKQMAPPHSFIHVDEFKSPRLLARQLKLLDKNDNLYNEYFRWKTKGRVTIEVDQDLRKSQFWCRLCTLLHEPEIPTKTLWNLDKWWNTDTQCVNYY